MLFSTYFTKENLFLIASTFTDFILSSEEYEDQDMDISLDDIELEMDDDLWRGA